VTERFWLSADGRTLLGLQEFDDPDVLENRGARFMAWDRVPASSSCPTSATQLRAQLCEVRLQGVRS
jgi:hypothetical protein